MNRPEIIAYRRTYDGALFELWSDGSVTSRGCYLPGVGRPRSEAAQAAAVTAGWLAMGEACLWDLAEMPRLVQVARGLIRRQPQSLPGDLRAAMAPKPPRQPKPRRRRASCGKCPLGRRDLCIWCNTESRRRQL